MYTLPELVAYLCDTSDSWKERVQSMVCCLDCLLDLSFVVDHSSSIGGVNWSRILALMKSVVSLTNVEPSGTHVGAVSFGV